MCKDEVKAVEEESPTVGACGEPWRQSIQQNQTRTRSEFYPQGKLRPRLLHIYCTGGFSAREATAIYMDSVGLGTDMDLR